MLYQTFMFTAAVCINADAAFTAAVAAAAASNGHGKTSGFAIYCMFMSPWCTIIKNFNQLDLSSHHPPVTICYVCPFSFAACHISFMLKHTYNKQHVNVFWLYMPLLFLDKIFFLSLVFLLIFDDPLLFLWATEINSFFFFVDRSL